MGIFLGKSNQPKLILIETGSLNKLISKRTEKAKELFHKNKFTKNHKAKWFHNGIPHNH